MKHSLTALLLTLALFCCLLTGCGPTSDVPGGSEGSNGSSSGSTNSGTEPDDANGTNSARLQPSVSMTSLVQPGALCFSVHFYLRSRSPCKIKNASRAHTCRLAFESSVFLHRPNTPGITPGERPA